MAGQRVFEVVWEPLLRGKFGPYADAVSAVYMWNKLKLRGSSRAKSGAEELWYYKGGFAALAEQIAERIRQGGGEIRTAERAEKLVVHQGRIQGVRTKSSVIDVDSVIATIALPLIADLLEPHGPAEYLAALRRIEYLANLCLVLVLDRSLSDTYWLNVNDPSFPYVGIIEHTNFEPTSSYQGQHVVYLSRYMPPDDELYRMSAEEVLEFSIPHIQRMFPNFSRDWVLASHVWRARWAQPVVVRHYRELIPPVRAPIEGLYLASMAQIHPEDRGTTYAIRDGRRVARQVMQQPD